MSSKTASSALTAFICAVRWEAACLTPFLGRRRRSRLDGRPLWTGVFGDGPALAYQCGIGRQAVLSGLDALLERYNVARIVDFGFAGSLEPELIPGDLIVVRRVAAQDAAACGQSLLDEALAVQALAAARRADLCVYYADLLTLDWVAGDPKRKRALAAAAPGYSAIDMETCWLAQAAAERGLPLLGVRTITDGKDDSLPALARRGERLDPGDSPAAAAGSASGSEPARVIPGTGAGGRPGTAGLLVGANPLALLRLLVGVRRAQSGLRAFFKVFDRSAAHVWHSA